MEKSRVKELLNKDVFLKIISVVIAVILWAYVSYVLDPETQKEITNIPVKFINEQTLLDSGLTLVEDDYFVSVQVKGRRNILSSIDNKRLWAEVDLAGYSKLGKNRAHVKICGLPSSVEIIREPQDIFIELDKTYSVEKNIIVNVTGEPCKGFAVLNPSVKPSTVHIEGSKRLINSIRDVSVIVDVSNSKNTFVTKEKINVIDNKGNIIRGLKCNVEIVDVEVPIVKVKEVQLKANLKGELAENMVINKIVLNPEKVLITAKDEILNQIKELNIESIDITNQRKDISTNVKILLPQGVKLVNSSDSVDVVIHFDKLITKSVWILKENISIINKKPNFDYQITTDKVYAVLEGFKEELSKIDAASITASIDVKDLGKGEHTVSLLANLPSNIKLKEESKVPVKVLEKE